MTERQPPLVRDGKRLVRNTRATVARVLRSIVTDLRHIRCPKDVREWRNLSLSQWASVLATFGYKVDRTSVAHWERGSRPVPEGARAAYGRALAWRVGVDSNDGIVAKLLRSWAVDVRRRCECGRVFKPVRANQAKCTRCRR